MATKTTFAFDAGATALLEQLADKKNISKAEVLRRALMLYDFVDEQRGDAKTIELKGKHGQEIHLLVP